MTELWDSIIDLFSTPGFWGIVLVFLGMAWLKGKAKNS